MSEVNLKPFTLDRVIEICEEIHRARRSGLAADLKAMGVSEPEAVGEAVYRLTRERGQVSPLLEYAASVPGSIALIREAATAQEIDGDAVCAGLDLMKRAQVAMALVGHPTSAASGTA